LEIAALEVDEEKRFLVVLAQVESHEVRFAHDLLRRFLEGDVQGLLALLDPFHQELDREGRLPRAARPQNDDGRLRPEASLDQVVEPRDSARYFLDIRHGMVPLGPRPERRGEGLAGWNARSMPRGF